MHGTPGGHDLDALYERWEERREIGALGEVLAECGFPRITGWLIGTLLGAISPGEMWSPFRRGKRI